MCLATYRFQSAGLGEEVHTRLNKKKIKIKKKKNLQRDQNWVERDENLF